MFLTLSPPNASNPARPPPPPSPRTYSPKMKVHIYAVAPNQEGDGDQQTVEALGWVSVDIRDMDDTNNNESWYKVHGAGGGCEVKLGLRLQKVKADTGSTSTAAAAALASSSNPAATATAAVAATVASPPPAKLNVPPPQPVEALPIGTGNDLFVCTVRIEFAGNLSSLHPPDLTAINRLGAWFSYSLFNVVVQTDKFYSWSAQPSNPTLFPPVTDAFRLCSSVNSLESFLKNQQPLGFYLCCNNNVVGGCKVSLASLVRDGLDSSGQFTGSTLTGKYEVKSDMSLSSPVASDDTKTPYLR